MQIVCVQTQSTQLPLNGYKKYKSLQNSLKLPSYGISEFKKSASRDTRFKLFFLKLGTLVEIHIKFDESRHSFSSN